MDPTSIAAALSDAGGWAAFVALVIAAGLGVVRGWWVPGFVYRREVTRADTMTSQLERNTDALKDLAADLTGRRPARRA